MEDAEREKSTLAHELVEKGTPNALWEKRSKKSYSWCKLSSERRGEPVTGPHSGAKMR